MSSLLGSIRWIDHCQIPPEPLKTVDIGNLARPQHMETALYPSVLQDTHVPHLLAKSGAYASFLTIFMCLWKSGIRGAAREIKVAKRL